MGHRTNVRVEGELEGSMKHTARAAGEALWAHKAGDDLGASRVFTYSSKPPPTLRESGSPRAGIREDTE